MLKIVFCLKRRADLTPEEFQAYWLERHAPLVKAHAAALNMRRYTQSHALPASAATGLSAMRGAEGLHFDGVAEVWFDSWESFIAPAKTAEGRAAGVTLFEDERNFIDLANSPIFLAEEHVIVG